MVPSGFFLGRVTADLTGGDYSFLEYWLTGGAALPTAKAGGVYGGPLNPGRAVNGAALAVGDWVLVRQAAGEGGLKWELVPIPSSSGAAVWGESVLAGDVNLAYGGVAGLSVTIPSAGAYLIYCTAAAYLAATFPGGATVGAVATVGGITTPIVNEPVSGVPATGTAGVTFVRVFAAGDVVGMGAEHYSSDSFATVFTSSRLLGAASFPSGGTRLGYLKLG